MPTAYIDTTVTAMLGDVCIIEKDCTAEVEYQIEDGDLADWYIRDFRFDDERTAWDDMAGEWTRKKVAEHWCPDELRPAFLHYADKEHIEERLVEKLIDSGEISLGSAAESLRSDYHASVL